MAATVKTLARRGASLHERFYLIEIFKGMATTFGHFFRNLRDNRKLYVRHYPEVQPEIPVRWRGQHRLTKHADGTVKCVACFMCQTNCPANCIMIEAGERQDGKTEKMPVKFVIDQLECIYCGYCVEACPLDAIRMDTGKFSTAGCTRESFVVGLDQLLATPGAFSEEEYKKGALDIMFAEILFFGFAVLSVLGAIGLVLFRHPMNGAMSLVVTMISLAGLYALLSAKLIFALQLIVYAGAIMSLILFIIMFLNIAESDLPEEGGHWVYLVGGIILILPIGSFLIKIVRSIPGGETTIVGNGFGGVKEVGLVLFQDWLLPFEIVSILLLVALIGSVVLAGKRRTDK